MSNPDAKRAEELLNRLHQERLSYDEYTLLIDTIHDLVRDNEVLTQRIETIRKAIYGD